MAKRWSVAAVGVPFVGALLYLGGWPIAILFGAAAGLGAWECYRLADRGEVAALDGLGVASAATLVLFGAWRPTFAGFAPPALALLGALTIVALVVAMRVRGPSRKPLEVVAITVFGTLYAGLSLAFVPLLHALPTVSGWGGADTGSWGGLLVVALPLAATWIGDAVALYAGRAWGHGGLAPTISPKKSWVGAWAGLAGAGAAGALWWAVARPFLPGMPIESPFLAAVVGAHFLPFEWVYRTRVYRFLGLAVAGGPLMLAIAAGERMLHFTGFYVGAALFAGALAARAHARRVRQASRSAG